MTEATVEYSPAEAARRLGVSVKALRLYEARGLLRPLRNAAGWRLYGATEMARAREIVSLRAMGLSLAQIGAALAGQNDGLEPALARHLARLDRQMHTLARQAERARMLRHDLARGEAADLRSIVALTDSRDGLDLSLPWPWGGEVLVLPPLKPVTMLTGPLGSGKTRLAELIAVSLPGGAFLGLDRLDDAGVEAARRLEAEPGLQAVVGPVLHWLEGDGATLGPALITLLVGLLDPAHGAVVCDLVEDGLDAPTQEALGAWLGTYDDASHPLVLMTRSSAVLDLETARLDRPVLYCPPNHSLPQLVLPHPGAAGYEAVADCLAPPEVRARVGSLRVAAGQPDTAKRPG